MLFEINTAMPLWWHVLQKHDDAMKSYLFQNIKTLRYKAKTMYDDQYKFLKL